jgi:acetylglutamate kinase
LRILIKLGGTLLEDSAQRASLASQLAEVARSNPLIVVHGGGKQVTRFLEERGVRSRFVRGLRVTDDAVIDAVTKVISGTVNQQLVSALVATGIGAVGLSGIDGPLTIAKQLDPELGYVGQPLSTNAKLLDLLSGAGYVPTIACVAGDYDGNVYNVNADQMAVSCAAGWKADKLIFLTDVPGVKDSSGTVLHQLSAADSRRLIADGVAHGGMQAKLEAAESALEQGVAEVDIASGREPSVCRRLLSAEALGTRLYLESQTA